MPTKFHVGQLVTKITNILSTKITRYTVFTYRVYSSLGSRPIKIQPIYTWYLLHACVIVRMCLIHAHACVYYSGVGTVKRLGGPLGWCKVPPKWDCPWHGVPENLRQEATSPHYDIIIRCGLATSLLALNKN